MPEPRGRPTLYTPELAADICRLIVTADPTTGQARSVRSICTLDGMPCRDTIYDWLLTHKDFAERYGRAMELRADQLFDECLDIADDTSADKVLREMADSPAIEVFDREHIARSRLRIDTRKWMAGRMAPKKYGDRVINNHLGENDGPINVKTEITDRARARALAAFVAKTRSAKA